MLYAMLGTAIAVEVVGTMCLRWSDGFTRLVPSVAVVLCYVTAFYLLSQVLDRGLALAVTYAVWSAAGIVVIALLDALVFREQLGLWQAAGIALIVVGVVVVQLGTPDQHG